MDNNTTIHPYCDICGKELSKEELDKNLEFENYEFPICDQCFKDTIDKIKYILNK